jgi:hypothetical protein
MKNLSSLFKANALSIIALLASAASLVAASLANSAILMGIAAFQCLALSGVIFYSYKSRKFIDDTCSTLKEIKHGNFEARHINLDEEGDLRKLSDSVNNAIDVCDAFVRESMLAMKAASEKRYFTRRARRSVR